MPRITAPVVGIGCGVCSLVVGIGCLIGASIMSQVNDGMIAMQKRFEDASDFNCQVYSDGSWKNDADLKTCSSDSCSNKPTDIQTGTEASTQGYKCKVDSNNSRISCPCLEDELMDVKDEPGNANWMNLSVGAVSPSGGPAQSPWGSEKGACVQVHFIGEDDMTGGLVPPVAKSTGPQFSMSTGDGSVNTQNKRGGTGRRLQNATNDMTKWQDQGAAGNLHCTWVKSSKDYIQDLVGVGYNKQTIVELIAEPTEQLSSLVSALWILAIIGLSLGCCCTGMGTYFRYFKKEAARTLTSAPAAV